MREERRTEQRRRPVSHLGTHKRAVQPLRRDRTGGGLTGEQGPLPFCLPSETILYRYCASCWMCSVYCVMDMLSRDGYLLHGGSALPPLANNSQ